MKKPRTGARLVFELDVDVLELDVGEKWRLVRCLDFQGFLEMN